MQVHSGPAIEFRLRVMVLATGAGEGLDSSHWNETSVYPRHSSWGARVSEASEGLGASSWSRAVAHKL